MFNSKLPNIHDVPIASRNRKFIILMIIAAADDGKDLRHLINAVKIMIII